MNAKFLAAATTAGVLLTAGLFTVGKAAADPQPDLAPLRRADVTLPFTEIRQLLDEVAAARNKPEEAPPPPIAAAVTNASVQLSLDAGQPSGTAQFSVNVLEKGWQVIPLMGAAFTLTGITPADAVVFPRDGMLCLLANHPGVENLTLSFDVPKTFVAGSGGTLAIRVAPSAVGRIQITKAPAGKRVSVNGEPVQAGTTGQLPAGGGDISITLAEDKPLVPTDWAIDSATLVTQNADHLDVESRVHLTGNTGSGVSAAALLPAGASEVEFDGGNDLKPVQFAAGADGRRTAALGWKTVGILDRDITVRYQIPLPEPGRAWKIEPPSFEGGHPGNGITVIAPAVGTDLTGSSGAMESAADRLPYWMQGKIPAQNFFVSRTPGSVSVQPTLLPRLSADSSRISDATFATRLVADGAMLCDAQVRVQHRGPLQWRFTLPAGSTLLKCEVEGTPASPLVCENGDLELAIPGGGTEQDSSSSVGLSYTAKNAKFDPVQGQLSVALPSTALFIEKLAWSLTLPDAYEATAFDGNVEIDSSTRYGLIQFRKLLSKNEAPQVNIYYRKHALNP